MHALYSHRVAAHRKPEKLPTDLQLLHRQKVLTIAYLHSTIWPKAHNHFSRLNVVSVLADDANLAAKSGYYFFLVAHCKPLVSVIDVSELDILVIGLICPTINHPARFRIGQDVG